MIKALLTSGETTYWMWEHASLDKKIAEVSVALLIIVPLLILVVSIQRKKVTTFRQAAIFFASLLITGIAFFAF